MGDIAVFLYKHARAIIAWTLAVSALAVFLSSIWSNPLVSRLGTWVGDAVTLAGRVVSSVPNHVHRINDGIAASVDGSDFSSLIFWLAGFDVLLDIFAFLAAEVSSMLGVCLVAVSFTITALSVSFAYRITQRFINATGGSELGNINVSD